MSKKDLDNPIVHYGTPEYEKWKREGEEQRRESAFFGVFKRKKNERDL